MSAPTAATSTFKVSNVEVDDAAIKGIETAGAINVEKGSETAGEKAANVIVNDDDDDDNNNKSSSSSSSNNNNEKDADKKDQGNSSSSIENVNEVNKDDDDNSSSSSNNHDNDSDKKRKLPAEDSEEGCKRLKAEDAPVIVAGEDAAGAHATVDDEEEDVAEVAGVEQPAPVIEGRAPFEQPAPVEDHEQPGFQQPAMAAAHPADIAAPAGPVWKPDDVVYPADTLVTLSAKTSGSLRDGSAKFYITVDKAKHCLVLREDRNLSGASHLAITRWLGDLAAGLHDDIGYVTGQNIVILNLEDDARYLLACHPEYFVPARGYVPPRRVRTRLVLRTFEDRHTTPRPGFDFLTDLGGDVLQLRRRDLDDDDGVPMVMREYEVWFARAQSPTDILNEPQSLLGSTFQDMQLSHGIPARDWRYVAVSGWQHLGLNDAAFRAIAAQVGRRRRR